MFVFNDTYPTRQAIDATLADRAYITIVGAPGMVLRIVDLTVDFEASASAYGLYIVRDRAGDFDGTATPNGVYPGVAQSFDPDPDGVFQLDVWCAAGSGTYLGAFIFEVEIESSPGVWEPLDTSLVTSISIGSTGAASYLAADEYVGVIKTTLVDAVALNGEAGPTDLELTALIEAGIVGRDLLDVIVILVLRDNAVFDESFNLLRTYLLRDRMGVAGTASKQGLVATKQLDDVAVFEAEAAAIVILLLAEGVVFGATITATYTQIAAVIAKLVLTGRAQNYAQALVMVLDNLVAADLAAAMRRGDLADTVALNAAVEPTYRLIAQLLDRLLTTDLASGHFTLSALVLDRFVVGADLTQTAEVVKILRDSIGFSFTLTIDGGEYIAWVMNTASKGVSRYSNYPFNSFMKVGDTQFAVASDGVHRLGGDDDNGTSIDAQIRLGLSALGTRKLKRVPECFIGMSSRDGGTLLIKVITVDELTGDKKAYVYEMVHRPALTTRENRRKFGQGLQSVDWDFEIANVDGKHFDLASIQFRPVILDRRTRG
jgi:hypothetical protein